MAHTLDTNARIPASGTSTANPLAQNYTCGAGTTVIVLMLVYQGVTTRAGGAPTYNGLTMTQAALTQGVTECSAEIWYRLDPPTGSAYSLSIPNTGGLTMCGAIASGKAASSHTSVLDEADSTETTGSNPLSPEVACSVAGDILFAVVATGDQTFSPTARTGTSLYEEDITSWGWGAQYMLKAGTGNQSLGWTEATEDDYGVVIVAFKEEGSSPSASPSEGTPSGSPSEGTPSGSPSEGTPSGSPSEGTPSGSPSEGTPSGSPSGSPSSLTQVVQDVRVLCAGSPSASPSGSPSEGTPSASPSEGTPSGSPSEGTPSGSPSEGTPSGSPSEGTPSGSPSEGTPSGSPSEGTPSGSPSEGTPSGSPSEGTPSGSPSEGTPSGSPSEGTPSGSPSHSPSGSPSEGTPSASPSGSPSEGTPSASPSEGTPSASPSEGTPSGSPSEGTPSGSPSHSPSASPSEGTPSASPSASPSEGTPSASPSEGTPSASPSPSPSASPSEEPECRPIHYGPQIEPVGDPIPTAWDGVEPIEGPMPIEGIFTYDADLDEPTTAYPKPHYGQREGPVRPLII